MVYTKHKKRVGHFGWHTHGKSFYMSPIKPDKKAATYLTGRRLSESCHEYEKASGKPGKLRA
ncbi:hypothetical protein ACLQ97_05920, partial [Bordetella avium]|uniref:hypothetical protein n=1 Tax=Bordetella avium TaxID=521 RepID=UPI0039FBF8D9